MGYFYENVFISTLECRSPKTYEKLYLLLVCFFSRQLPVPYGKSGGNGGTAIPLPATVLVTRRCPPDKVRPLPPTPNHQQRK
jgi:hypothetical protein